MASNIVIAVYGLLLLSGAYFGWKAGSQVSLIMGLLSGAVVFVGLKLAQSNLKLGYGIVLGVSGLLTVMFLIRFLKTQKVMPSGMLLAASAVALIISLLTIIKK